MVSKSFKNCTQTEVKSEKVYTVLKIILIKHQRDSLRLIRSTLALAIKFCIFVFCGKIMFHQCVKALHAVAGGVSVVN